MLITDNDETWQNLAFLYRYKNLELHEVVKVGFIMTVAGFIEDEVNPMGYGILKNKELYAALTAGIIGHYPEGEAINQGRIANALNWSRPSTNGTIKWLTKNDKIEHPPQTDEYIILEDLDEWVPKWMQAFCKGLIALEYDEALRVKLDKSYEKFEFMRGLQVLWDEIKSVRPRKSYRDE